MNDPKNPNTHPENPSATIQITNEEAPQVITVEADPNDLTVSHESHFQGVEMIATGAQKIKRPITPTKETLAAIHNAAIQNKPKTEEEKMRDLINLPPSFQDDEQEDNIQVPVEEIADLATEESISPPTSELTTSYDNGPQFSSEFLGMVDSNLDDDPRFNDTPLHVPDDPTQIKQITELTKDDLVQMPADIIDTPTSKEMISPEVQKHTQIELDVVPQKVNKPNTIGDLQSDEFIVIDQEEAVLSTTSSQVVTPVLEDKEEEKEIPIILSLAEEVTDIIGNVATEEEINQAFDEIPTIDDLSLIDLSTVSKSDITGIDNLNDLTTVNEDDIDNILDFAVESAGKVLYGDQYQQLFTSKDLDLEFTDSDNTTLVIPNVSFDDLTQYCLQSTPTLIKNTTNELYRNHPEAIQALTPELQRMNMTINDPSSYLHRMHSSRQFFNTPNREFQQELLRMGNETFQNKNDKPLAMSRAVKIKDKEGNLFTVDDTKGDKNAAMTKLQNGSIITGTSSFKMASLLISGIRKVNLYSSGIFVVLLAPKLDLLTKYYNTVRLNTSEYGRTIGQFSFLPAGVETRAALFDLVEKLVVDSNLVDYDKPGILRKAVSSLDYSTLIWAVASLMYPKGVDVESVCFNNNTTDGKPCRHVESLKIDINNMRFNNWSLLNSEAIRFTESKEPRVLDQLTDYHQKYLGDTEKECSITEDGTWKAYLSIPSVFDAEMAQRAYIAEMITSLQISNEEKVSQYVKSKYLTSFMPYVQKITYTDPEHNKTIIFKDPLALGNALDNLQLKEDANLGDAIVEFLAAHAITHVCFTHHKCPKCGQLPPEAINGLIACDPEYAFFMWATARIPQ